MIQIILFHISVAKSVVCIPGRFTSSGEHRVNHIGPLFLSWGVGFLFRKTWDELGGDFAEFGSGAVELEINLTEPVSRVRTRGKKV